MIHFFINKHRKDNYYEICKKVLSLLTAAALLTAELSLTANAYEYTMNNEYNTNTVTQSNDNTSVIDSGEGYG
ncbi:MAG: hypothetical protein IIZ46_03040 [Clostridia bacterium]|nr:hypothetical protein [Clostridia bacterium]